MVRRNQLGKYFVIQDVLITEGKLPLARVGNEITSGREKMGRMFRRVG